MYKIRELFTLLAAISCFVAGLETVAYSIILPQNYRLIPSKDHSPAADPDLDRWLAAFAMKSSEGQKREWRINQDTGSFDTVLEEFALLSSSKKVPGLKKKVSELRQKMLEGDGKKPHPLLPYVHELWYRLKGSRQTDLEDFYRDLTAPGIGLSCPRFRFLEGRLTDRRSVNQFTSQTKHWLGELKKSANREGIRRILQVMLPMVSGKNRKVYAQTLKPFAREYEKTLAKAAWVFQGGGGKNDRKPLAKISYMTKKRKCYSARSFLVRQLKSGKGESLSFVQAARAAKAVESCFRRKGFKSRLALLRFLKPHFMKKFGFRGEAEINYLLARALWNGDRFQAAEKILEDLTVRSRNEKDHPVLARVMFLKAQIAENQEQFSRAVARYELYLARFPGGDSAEQAIRALIVLHAGMQQWDKVLSQATEMVTKQQHLTEDARHVSLMGFGLFWAGRAALELNRPDMAKEFWRLVARDYFSTYYGAIGHYMVEKLSGKEFVLQPFFSERFANSMVYRPFTSAEHGQVSRIQMLLRLGRAKDAACEAAELKEDATDPARRMVKSLFYHSTGDWLQAVQMFGNLPRTFRKGLSFGLERILFPRKYQEHVEFYGKKMNIDPEFIFSVIRQESVFNPRARSVAGARGLMQLMSRTARLEAKKLRKSYVSRSKRKLVRKNVRRKSGLYHTETNIILGTHYLKNLLRRYNNVPLALAAYNAGPTVVGRWRKKFSTDDPFYFIEMIPYKETRDYVKLILRNYFYYTKWYPSGRRSSLTQLDRMTFPLLALTGQNTETPR